jgi:hypothetical protein
VLALAVTAGVTDRAASGVGGVSQLRRRIYWLSLAVGLLGVYVMQPALRHAGASHGVISVFTASSPLLVAGVVLAAGTAAWLNWYAFGLGVWLIAVTAQETMHPIIMEAPGAEPIREMGEQAPWALVSAIFLDRRQYLASGRRV